MQFLIKAFRHFFVFVVLLASASFASAASLLPFDYSWTLGDVKKIIAAGADINARDEYGETPLMIAAIFNKNPEIIEVLLKNNPALNLKDDSGKTAFDYAKQNKNIRNTESYWILNDARFE